ncbi:hypothetical protein ABTH49_19905, partial [Acinetobacter baumannii]
KTTALQALALWDIGWRRWAEKRDRSSASERQGVTIYRPRSECDSGAERARRLETLDRCLGELLKALEIICRPSPWGGDIKATAEFLDPLMEN